MAVAVVEAASLHVPGVVLLLVVVAIDSSNVKKLTTASVIAICVVCGFGGSDSTTHSNCWPKNKVQQQPCLLVALTPSILFLTCLLSAFSSTRAIKLWFR